MKVSYAIDQWAVAVSESESATHSHTIPIHRLWADASNFGVRKCELLFVVALVVCRVRPVCQFASLPVCEFASLPACRPAVCLFAAVWLRCLFYERGPAINNARWLYRRPEWLSIGLLRFRRMCFSAKIRCLIQSQSCGVLIHLCKTRNLSLSHLHFAAQICLFKFKRF